MPAEITLSVERIFWAVAVIFAGGFSWATLRWRIATVRSEAKAAKKSADGAYARADHVSLIAEGAHRRINEMEKEQAAEREAVTGKLTLLTQSLGQLHEQQKEMGEDIKKLIRNGCAIGCRPRET